MTPLVAGLVGGFAGTIAFTVVMMANAQLRASPSGPALLWSRITGAGVEAGSTKAIGMLGHLLYGTVAGGVLLLLVDTLGLGPALLWLWGILWGVVLLMIMMLVWGPATGMSQGMKQMPQEARKSIQMNMMAGHLVYGLVTGVVAGFLLG